MRSRLSMVTDQITDTSINEGEAHLTVEKSEGGQVVDKKEKNKKIKNQPLIKGACAYVGVGAGHTINTGNYNSVRIDAFVVLPCEATDRKIAECSEKCLQYADKILEKQLDDINKD